MRVHRLDYPDYTSRTLRSIQTERSTHPSLSVELKRDCPRCTGSGEITFWRPHSSARVSKILPDVQVQFHAGPVESKPKPVHLCIASARPSGMFWCLCNRDSGTNNFVLGRQPVLTCTGLGFVGGSNSWPARLPALISASALWLGCGILRKSTRASDGIDRSL